MSSTLDISYPKVVDLLQCRTNWYKNWVNKQDEMEKWRVDLFKLQKARESMILELGLYAQENGDLRENSAYLHTEQKIHVLDAQIMGILTEFNKMELAKKKIAHLQKLKRSKN